MISSCITNWDFKPSPSNEAMYAELIPTYASMDKINDSLF